MGRCLGCLLVPIVLAAAVGGTTQHGLAQGELPVQITAALDRARPVLFDMAKTSTQGVHALICLALAHGGSTMADPEFRQAISRLEDSKLAQTYDLSVRLMVMAEVQDYPARRRAADRDLAQLLKNQRGGGFGYTPKGGHWDLSNTQYAALGMRAAASLGVPISRRRWIALGRTVLTAQVRRGGFGYRPKGRGSNPSMTVAGIAVLQICRMQLNDKGTLSKRMRSAIRRAWDYMANNKESIGAGSDSQRSYYFHYGLERAAILSDLEMVDGIDWYRTGVRMLLEDQDPDGGWGAAPWAREADPRRPEMHRGGEIMTAFAVLFLRHSFRKTLTTGPITPRPRASSDLRTPASVRAG